jgi:hypothetical protein
MGYDVHVTRALHWTESRDTPITLEEWLALVKADPELRLDGQATARTNDGVELRYENAGLAVWTGGSARTAGDMRWIDHRDGELVVKNPDDELMRKLHQLATVLRAKVQGDDGEEYDAQGRVIGDAAPTAPSPDTGSPKRPWWKVIFGLSR